MVGHVVCVLAGGLDRGGGGGLLSGEVEQERRSRRGHDGGPTMQAGDGSSFERQEPACGRARSSVWRLLL
jgi:hypothetical protein